MQWATVLLLSAVHQFVVHNMVDNHGSVGCRSFISVSIAGPILSTEVSRWYFTACSHKNAFSTLTLRMPAFSLVKRNTSLSCSFSSAFSFAYKFRLLAIELNPIVLTSCVSVSRSDVLFNFVCFLLLVHAATRRTRERNRKSSSEWPDRCKTDAVQRQLLWRTFTAFTKCTILQMRSEAK
ncbi:hypothetical protein DFJ77DRAFT_446084 [Powellomyces hirtus]|nr:hypothetical protein DFJ77DRAFT_446084 [Powellomyces hirtus]